MECTEYHKTVKILNINLCDSLFFLELMFMLTKWWWLAWRPLSLLFRFKIQHLWHPLIWAWRQQQQLGKDFYFFFYYVADGKLETGNSRTLCCWWKTRFCEEHFGLEVEGDWGTAYKTVVPVLEHMTTNVHLLKMKKKNTCESLGEFCISEGTSESRLPMTAASSTH